MLPLGISFYTFQSMGYVMDVYREIVEPEKNFLKVALFVSFFPQIIQGPIAIYDKLAGQLYEDIPSGLKICKGCASGALGSHEKACDSRPRGKYHQFCNG